MFFLYQSLCCPVICADNVKGVKGTGLIRVVQPLGIFQVV